MFGKKKTKEDPKPRSSFDSKLLNFERLSSTSSTFQSTTTTITERKISTQTIKSDTNMDVVKPQFNTFSGTGSTDKSLPKPDARFLFYNPPSAISKKPINLNYQSPYRTNNNSGAGVRSSFLTTATRQDAIPISTIPSRKTSEPVIAVPRSSSYTNNVLKLQPPSSASSPSTSTKSLSALNENKKLIVKKTGKHYDNGPIPVYSTKSKKRGEVLIINNIHFSGKDERSGAKSDDTNLKTVFKQLKFTITDKRDLSGAQMEKTIKNFSKNKSLKSVDIVVVIIMSHGTNRLHVSGTEIFGIDDKALSTDDILDFFTAENCPHLSGKPKIFIFQCCRSLDSFQKTDAVPFTSQRIGHSDMLIAFSTLPGFVSFRDPKAGTWYIQTLCDVLCEHAHEYHIEELLKIVDSKIVRCSGLNQVTTYESRGFKRCYFHP